jgi:hypothetical protein
MPTYNSPQHGVSFSEAAAEAYAIAPVDRVMVDTIELLHSSFIGDDGYPDSVRVACNTEDLLATIEDGAPMHAGQEVTFIGLPVVPKLPEEGENGQDPVFEFFIDNVSEMVSRQLDLAVETLEPIIVIYREYASDDTSGPTHLPTLKLELRKVDVDDTRVTATAAFADSVNRKFPGSVYDERYPGLSAR